MKVDLNSERVILALADGWTDIDWYEDNQGPAILTGYPPPGYPRRHGMPDTRVPNYGNELEQVRRLETKLVTDDAYQAYMDELKATCAEVDGMSGLVRAVQRVNRYECASASQRCRALVRFLRITGKGGANV